MLCCGLRAHKPPGELVRQRVHDRAHHRAFNLLAAPALGAHGQISDGADGLQRSVQQHEAGDQAKRTRLKETSNR